MPASILSESTVNEDEYLSTFEMTINAKDNKPNFEYLPFMQSLILQFATIL